VIKTLALDLSPNPSPRRGEVNRASEKCDIHLYIIEIQRNTHAKVELLIEPADDSIPDDLMKI
jgi:hypothetical protein